MKKSANPRKKRSITSKNLQYWKEIATKTILPRTFSDIQCCVLNSNSVYMFQRQIDMRNTNNFAIYYIGNFTTQYRL